MVRRDAFLRRPRAKPYALAAVTAGVVFLEAVTRSRQYAIREGQPVTARTPLDLVVDVAGTYLVVPGLLFVAFYALIAPGSRIPLTGRSLLALFAGALIGGLAGQYVGVAPHSLRTLLWSGTFAADPQILRLWVDVFGSIGRDFLVAVGVLVVARTVRDRRNERSDAAA
ncbi:hypothetical protein PM076_06065 [Halorubrum ezzemoulense]|uniref:Signal peptidase II n=1 Tax=Halorubrum ezzemoulense TaxID=337243 RepID=A0ABT4YY00_HALEZ|nr:hypothetical protein [Halorubrum ezzemoulense]MDB2245381.1 hypothetical protein [Halorubrum ezzemoulense]MDB2250267.1 hypothetical protein [Halorubrum ezzemoulense]MDB2279241.1 hypothetical protein [Halorubrum ezzemoulense]MDB2285523.1 hypothetical protein [Halorubrum ezzemoulense]MDB2287337.1 hypothetical protein [Halorubrum ezzemoulense]